MTNYYEQVKEKLIDTETTIRVKDYTKNRVMLENYYEVGRLIVEAQGGESRAKYGDGLIKEYSRKLTEELGKGYSTRTLKDMRNFYLFQKGHAVRAQLSWTNYRELFLLKDYDKEEYYINISIKNNLSSRELHRRIKSKEYERLPEYVKEKLRENQELELKETIINPIVIPNPKDIEITKEKELQKLIMENIYLFLKRLGTGYHFVGNEYSIRIGDRNYKIDLLLYNKVYKSYVVIELKIGELKHSYISQVELYMNYVDKNLKDVTDNKTIGIILCERDNRLLMEYCSKEDIIIREYVLNN